MVTSALILDCDGVLADTELHGHLVAFNQTFEEFGLPVRWTVADYKQKVRIGGGKERLASLLTPEFVAAAGLARPGNGLVAARCTARTVDTIWAAAGDTSADFSWYTKRAILAAVYSATLFYWLSGSGEMEQTLAFLDRRLAGVAKLGKLRARLAA